VFHKRLDIGLGAHDWVPSIKIGCFAKPPSRRPALQFNCVTRTATVRLICAPLAPVKMPLTGMAWLKSRATATGIRLKPPIWRLVGSKVIQPAPGTNTSAQAWVVPDPKGWLGLKI